MCVCVCVCMSVRTSVQIMRCLFGSMGNATSLDAYFLYNVAATLWYTNNVHRSFKLTF